MISLSSCPSSFCCSGVQSSVTVTSLLSFYSGDVNEMEGIVYRIKINKKTGRFEKLEGVTL
ncbi:MAG: hypothetical protein M3R72_09605 [Bacteroidota bacterium]|nr:hypothetical protein [Bacteroidota bacterium]